MIAQTRKFHHRLNRLVAAQLVITALFVGSKIHSDFNNRDQQLRRDIEIGVTAVSLATSDFIDLYTGILKVIERLPFVAAADTEKASTLFRRLNDDFPDVVNFAATTADGRFFASGQAFDRLNPPTIQNLDFFQAVAGGDRRFIMTPHMGPISHAVVTGVAIPRLTEDGIFQGIMGCSIRLDALTRKWEAVFRQSDVSFLIIDRNHQVIAASKTVSGYVNQPVSGLAIDQALATAGDGSAAARIAGRQCQYRSATLDDSGLRLIGFQALPTVFQVISDHPEYMAFGIPLALLIVFQIVLLFRDRAISRDLFQSETRYQQLIESLNEGIWAIDKENRTTYANDRMAEMLGTTVDQMLGQPLFAFMDEAGRAVARQKLSQRMQGEAEQHEFTFLRHDGSRMHALLATSPRLDEAGRYIGAVAGVLDITDYKRTQTALKQREKLLNETGRMAKIGGWTFDVHSRTGHWTEETARIHDMEPGEMTDVEKGLGFFQGKNREVIEQALNKAIALGLPYDLELEMVTARGNRKWVRTVGNPVTDTGRVVGVTGIIQDITERKQAELALKQLNAQLEQRVMERTAQLEAKNKELESFTYSVSHDLKAPLRGIDGYSRLLLEDHARGLNDEGRFFIDTIRMCTGQMNRLIDDLLAYSRLERRSIGRETIDLGPFVAGLIRDYDREIKDRGAIFIAAVPDIRITADREGLATALHNYMDNAIKFTAKTTEARIEVGARETVTGWLVWVRDNGVGFDMRFHDRIFEIFQRLHRAEDYPGSGIGLALVKKAMERMGGQAWAESQPEGGATFFLELPASG